MKRVTKAHEKYINQEKCIQITVNVRNAKKSHRLTAHKKDSCPKLENTEEKESQNKREKKMVKTY